MKHYITPSDEIRAFEEDGSQDHLITADMKPVTLPDVPSGAWVKDYENGTVTVDQAALDAIQTPVPAFVSSRQGMQQLILDDLDEAVEAEVVAIADPKERKLMRAWLDRAEVWERSNPQFQQMATALGLSEAQVDDMLRNAAKL